MSTTPIERLTEVQEKVVETVQSFHDPIVSNVKRAAEYMEQYVPEVPTERFTEALPTARELVDNHYKFAARLLDANHKLVTDILEAVEPVTEKVVKPSPSATKKSVKKVPEAA